MRKLELIGIGGGTGAVFPEEMLARLRVGIGDVVFVVETRDGLLLTPVDPTIAEQLETGRAFAEDYRETFAALAE